MAEEGASASPPEGWSAQEASSEAQKEAKGDAVKTKEELEWEEQFKKDVEWVKENFKGIMLPASIDEVKMLPFKPDQGPMFVHSWPSPPKEGGDDDEDKKDEDEKKDDENNDLP